MELAQIKTILIDRVKNITKNDKITIYNNSFKAIYLI